ncbi:MAG: hypothetical protein NXY57DRAFT_993841 [Lentinula lateritia]|nr:MAG: hypothetical protein NXY57DRAFT_993841 [Lentinula lateritia]
MNYQTNYAHRSLNCHCKHEYDDMISRDSCNRHSDTLTSLGYEPDRIQPSTHPYSYNICTPHVHRTSTDRNSGMSHSGYRPRQSIPSDVCNISSCLNDEKGAEVHLGQDDPRQKESSRTGSEVHAEHSNLSKVHAIDPACLRPIVRFDYACLEDLDEELILRPRSAFAEMCWSTAVQNIPRTTNQRQSLAQSLPFTSKCREPCSALGRRSPSHSSRSSLNFKVSEGFFAADEGGQSECHSSSESDRSPSNTWYGSIEESSVMVVTGRLNVLENHDGVKLVEKKSSPGTVVVPSDSIIHVTSTYYHEHDNAGANDRLDIPRHCGDHSDNENSRMEFHDEEESNADVGPCISIQDDDDVLLSQPHFLPALITHSVPQTDALLYSHLYSYGVANPQESVGFFPIPVAGSRTTVNWEGRCGIKLSSKSRSFGSNISKFCQAVLPLSKRVVKR